MQYHAPTHQFTVDPRALADFAVQMRYVIRKIREASKLPLDGGGKRPAAMTDACHAELTLIGACKSIGVDLGADRHGELDVRNAG